MVSEQTLKNTQHVTFLELVLGLSWSSPSPKKSYFFVQENLHFEPKRRSGNPHISSYKNGLGNLPATSTDKNLIGWIIEKTPPADEDY